MDPALRRAPPLAKALFRRLFSFDRDPLPAIILVSPGPWFAFRARRP
jgi:hypothetical protein